MHPSVKREAFNQDEITLTCFLFRFKPPVEVEFASSKDGKVLEEVEVKSI